MMQKTPELKEYFTDGQYGSPQVDNIMVPNNIKQYQTGIRGRPSYGGLRIHQEENGELYASCKQGQYVKVIKRQGWSAIFDFTSCQNCPFANQCVTKISGVKKNKPKRTWYFQQKNILAHLRFNNFETLPENKKTLRASVEATVRQMQYGMKNGKVRVRTKDRISNYMTLTAIATNIKRIHAYLSLGYGGFSSILFDHLTKFVVVTNRLVTNLNQVIKKKKNVTQFNHLLFT